MPFQATAPALVLVGYLMFTLVKDIDVADVESGIPALLTMILMPLTYDITVGIGAGFISWVVIQIARGKAAGVNWLSQASFEPPLIMVGVKNDSDTWAMNELSSAVRKGTGTARRNALDFLHGLASDGAKGIAFAAGVGQSTTDLSTYKVNLQNWLQDAAFWSEAAGYVSDWAQENYGDVRDYAVGGSTAQERRDAIVQYLGHEVALANAGPEAAGPARDLLRSRTSRSATPPGPGRRPTAGRPCRLRRCRTSSPGRCTRRGRSPPRRVQPSTASVSRGRRATRRA